MSCVFCEIVAGRIATKLLHEDPLCVAFADLHPQAPVHCLIVPREHLATLGDLTASHEPLIGRMVAVAAKLAKEQGIDGRGYRTVFNCNADGGQTVFHIHLHLLGGRRLTWPPG